MRINPVSSNLAVTNKFQQKNYVSKQTFNGKHDCTKALGGIFGAAGTLGALGGIAIMTGGVSLVPTIIYGAMSAAAGAWIGHDLDKDDNNTKSKE